MRRFSLLIALLCATAIGGVLFLSLQQTVYVELQTETDLAYRPIGSTRLAPWSEYSRGL